MLQSLEVQSSHTTFHRTKRAENPKFVLWKALGSQHQTLQTLSEIRIEVWQQLTVLVSVQTSFNTFQGLETKTKVVSGEGSNAIQSD